MVNDNFGAGMGYLLLFIGFFLVVSGSIEITVIYSILKRTTNRVIHVGIPAILLLLGFILLMRFDASLLIFGSLLFVAPMAALIPPLVIPGLIDPETGLDRILICNIFVSIFGAGLLIAFALSGLSMVPEVFWHTPLSNAIIFAGVIILDTLFAFLIYRIMQIFRPAGCVKNEKPGS
jgi:hypothetical protein